MCFHSIDLYVAPDGATSLGFVRGYKHFAPPEQRILCPLRAFQAKPVEWFCWVLMSNKNS